MPDGYENQISPDEFDYEAELQRDRARQKAPASPEKPAETGPNLNIVELTLALILAIGVDFGIGWLGGLLAAGAAAIPIIGPAVTAVIFFLVKFATLGTAMILGLWCLLRLKKFPSARFGATAFIEVIPFIGELAPGWTAFVLSIIIKEKIMPILSKYSAAVEKIEKAKQAAEKIGGTAVKVGKAIAGT